NDYVVSGDERITYGDAHRDVRAVARWLREQAVRQGDRVAIATRNLPEWVIAFWAAQAIGAVVVPLNAWWTGPELAYGLADSGSVVLFADDERAERLAPHLTETDVRATGLIRSERAVPSSVRFSDVVAGADPPLPELVVDPD